MWFLRRSIIVLVAFFALGGAFGCEREGPAERAGEKIDETMEQAQERTEEAVEEAGEALEEAGEEVKESTK